MQMIHFTIYTICRISPPLILLYICACLLYLLLCLYTLFFSQSVNFSHTLSHCRLSIFLSASIFNSRRYHDYSSYLRHPGKLNFVFNIVEFPACSGRPAGRRGLCTGGLFDLISPMLVLPGNVESSSKTAVPKVMSTVERAAERGLCSLNSWRMFFLFAAAIVQMFRCSSCYSWHTVQEWSSARQHLPSFTHFIYFCLA